MYAEPPNWDAHSGREACWPAAQHLLRRHAITRRRGLTKPPADRVRVKTQRIVRDAAQHFPDLRRRAKSALVGVQLDGAADLLPRRVTTHAADLGPDQREGGR